MKDFEYDYVYDIPFRITSTVQIDVLNKDGKVEYFLQKYHKNMFQKILSFQFESWFINVSLKNVKNDSLINIEDIGILSRKWKIKDIKEDSVYEAKDTSKIKITKKFKFSVGDKNYLIEKDMGDKETRFFLENEKIIQMKFDKVLPPRKNHIKVLKPNQIDIPIALAALHLFEIGV